MVSLWRPRLLSSLLYVFSLSYFATRFSASVICSLLLAGCVTLDTPELPTHTPTSWSEQSPKNAPAIALRSWWQTWQDPTLNALIDEALTANLDLAQATQRLESERLIAGRWQSPFLPTITAGARPTQDVSATDMYYHASLDMTWELGLFGALDNSKLSANARLYQAEATEQGTRVIVIANVVRHYLALGLSQKQQQLLQHQLTLDEETLELALTRQRAHLGTPEESTQAQLRLAQTRANLALEREASSRSARALAVLLGREQPDSAWTQINAPLQAPAFTLTELPADLLRTRPDIHTAEADVLQAAAQVGLARSALFPRLSLGGSILYAYNTTQNMRTSTDYAPSVGLYVDIPLWDWGQRRTRIQANESLLDAALLGYRKAVLDGVSEVENALSGLTHQQERIQALESSEQALKKQQQSQRTLQSLGLSSRYDQLLQQRAVLETQSDLWRAHAARTLSFIALYKALGGAPLPEKPEETTP